MKKLLALLLLPIACQATDIASVPLLNSSVKPNIIIGYDDSGSMAWDYLPDSISSSSLKDDYHYNPLAYNPNTEYLPWVSSVASDGAITRKANGSIDSINMTFTEGDILTAGATYQVNYQCNNFRNTIDYETGNFFVSRRVCRNKDGNSYTPTSNYTVAEGQTWDFTAYGYYYDIIPKTDCPTCCVASLCPTGYICTDLPSGMTSSNYVRRLVAYTASSPSADKINYANWKAYYRTRQKLVAASMSEVLSSLTGIYMGILRFNRSDSNTVDSSGKMFDLDVGSDTTALLNYIYSIVPSGGTSTHQNLVNIGRAFQRTSITQYACQKDAAFVITDGYANGSIPSQVSYTAPTDKTTGPTYYNSNAYPYYRTYSRSLADIAQAYYVINPNSTLATGQVNPSGSCDPYSSDPLADCNINLHMNTYALTLGIPGALFVPDSEGVFPTLPLPVVADGVNSWGSDPISWSKLDTNAQIDDLWHATINGRGQMFVANNITELLASIKASFTAIALSSIAQSAASVGNVNLTTTNNKIYASSFDASNWTGDVNAYAVDLTSGAISSAVWSARDLLDNRTTARTFYIGPAGWGSVSTGIQNYLKGSRVGEGSTYRKRAHLLGDMVHAAPILENGMVYQASNDGMVHAFNATTGEESWAYIPSLNMPGLAELADLAYSHKYFVDSTPVVASYTVGDVTKTLLLGGLGAGGFGYYAIDITTPNIPNVLWEFSNPSAGVTGNTSIAQPRLIATHDTAYPYVVIVGSGYNIPLANASSLWVLNPVDGSVIKTISTSSVGVGGFATFAAFVPSNAIDNQVSYLYGGDETGHVWRVDTTGDVSGWTLAEFASIGQPITTKPDLQESSTGNPIVLFGTGRLLGYSDKDDTSTRGFYAIQDLMDPGVVQKSDLLQLTVTGASQQNRTISMGGQCQGWATGAQGWYFNFPEAGERLISDPVINLGYVSFITNVIIENSCSSASYSWILDLNLGANSSCFAPITGGGDSGDIPYMNQGTYLGQVYSSGPSILSLPGGNIVSLTHLSSGAFNVTNMGVMSGVSSSIRSIIELNTPIRPE